MGRKTQPTSAEREINGTSGKGRTKTVSAHGKYYLAPPPPPAPPNAKRNSKEIAFLERLKGSNKSSSVSRQRWFSRSRYFPASGNRDARRDRAAPPATTKERQKQTLESLPWENKEKDSPCPYLNGTSAQGNLKLPKNPLCPAMLQAAEPRSLDSPATS